MESQSEGVRVPLGLSDIPSHSLFMGNPPEELFHYTSIDGARGIIESKSLHLTKVAYLNDRSELGFAINLFQTTVNRIISTIKNSDHSSLLTDTARQLDSFAQINICVASFCEDGDLLSQWRSYAGLGKGVALGFSRDALHRVGNSGWAQLLRCVYEPADHQRITEDLIGILLKSYEIVMSVTPDANRESARKDLIGYFNTTFLRVAPALKDWHFREEKEWRLVTVSMKFTDPKFKVILSNSRVSQYCVYEFPPDQNGVYNFLSRIILGPSQESGLVSDALFVFCRKQNVSASFYSSQIPYRG